MFEPGGHRSADNYTVERGGGKENFSMREGKINLETDKWSSLFSETVSSLRDGAVITEFFVMGFVSRLERCPLTGQESALH